MVQTSRRLSVLVLIASLSCAQSPRQQTQHPSHGAATDHDDAHQAPTDDPGPLDTGTVAQRDTYRDVQVATAPVPPAPLHYDREITAEDLEGRSLRELAILRNEPYARHGHTFLRPWLRDYFLSQDWYHPQRMISAGELTPLERNNSELVARYELGLRRTELTRRRTELLQTAQTPPSPEQTIEAALLGSRLGVVITLTEGSVRAEEESLLLADPEASKRLLTLSQLRVLSPRDLRILRNIIYARHGRPFRTPDVAGFFANFDWYTPDEHYTDAMLTTTDRQNLRLIRSVEASLGTVPPDENTLVMA